MVGVLHGIIFWSVRRRQRRVREQTLREAHAMLRDSIQKQVAALLTMDARATEAQRKRLDGVFDSLILLDHLLDSLSSERLRAWTRQRGRPRGAGEARRRHRHPPRAGSARARRYAELIPNPWIPCAHTEKHHAEDAELNSKDAEN